MRIMRIIWYSECVSNILFYTLYYIYNIKIYSNDLMLKVENANDTHDT